MFYGSVASRGSCLCPRLVAILTSLHLSEGEGQGWEEAQASGRGRHQVICDPGVVIITQVAPEKFLIIQSIFFHSALAVLSMFLDF